LSYRQLTLAAKTHCTLDPRPSRVLLWPFLVDAWV
jgi:hypothetical protein